MSRESVVELIIEVNKLYGTPGKDKKGKPIMIALKKGDEGFLRRVRSDTEETLTEKLVEHLTVLVDTNPDPIMHDSSDDLSDFIISQGIVRGVEEDNDDEYDDELADDDEQGTEEEDDDEEDDEDDPEDEDALDEDDDESDEDESDGDEGEDEEEPGLSPDVNLLTIAAMIEAGFNKLLEAVQASGATRTPRKAKGLAGLSKEDQAAYALKMEAAKEQALTRVKALFKKYTTLDEITALAEKRKVVTKSSTMNGIKAAIRGMTIRNAQNKVKKEFAAIASA